MDYNNLPGFGKDQWIKYRWNRSYNNPYPEKEFEIYFQPKKATEILPIDIAATNVAEDICNTYKNKKIYLAMSGGIDSEYIAKILVDMKINFIPIILEIDKWNEIDVWWAYRWCKQNKINPYVLKINLDTLLLSCIDIAKKYCTKKPVGPVALSFCADIARQNNGILITGTGTHELYIPDPIMLEEADDATLKNKTGYVFNEADLLKHILMPDMPFIFFNWNPEITLSYIAARDPNKTTEENRVELFGCLPRPKIGVPIPKMSHFGDTNIKSIQRWQSINCLMLDIIKSESFYLGTTEHLINFFTNYEKV
jgi:hypothetical protein